MAYVTDIIERKCRRCGAKATVTLHHWRNHELGDFCRKHGSLALAEQQASEKRETVTAC